MAAVHLSADVAEWVVQTGGLAKGDLEARNQEMFAHSAPLFLSPPAARQLQNGAVMARLLCSLYAANGAACPVTPAALAPGNEAAAVLRNWKDCLLPVLRATFAIDLDADQLALLVGGDSEVLTHAVVTLYSRASGVAHPTHNHDAVAAPRHASAEASPAAAAAAGVLQPLEALVAKFTRRFDADVIDTLVLVGSLLSGLYAAVLASLLGLFVPQACPPTDAAPDWHVCSTTENLRPQSQLNGAVLAWNFLTLFIVLGGQAFFGYREYWCIQSFDFDLTLPNDNLGQEVRLYPSFAAKLARMNRATLRVAWAVTLAVTVNFILSCVHVLRDFSEGKASATALVSFTLLLAPRVLGWLLNAHRAVATGAPVSFFIKTPALPNTIDADWKFRPEVYKPRYAVIQAAAAAPAAAEEERVELLAAAA